MSTRNKPAHNQPPRSSPRAPASQAPAHGRLVSILIRLLGGTKNAILAVGALAGAVLAIVAVVTMVLPKGTHPSPPPAVNASFLEAKVEPNVLLEEYEYNNQPAALGTASAGSQVRAIGYQLAADTKPTSAQPAIAVLATVSRSSVGVSTNSSTTSEIGEPAGSSNQGTTVENTKEEPPGEKEAKKIKEREEAIASEEIKAKEEARRIEEAKVREAREATMRTRRKAQAKAREEAKAKAKEDAKVKQEEQEEEKLARIRKNTPAHEQGRDEKGATRYPAFAEPPPPATSFHKEGEAKVVVGTGAPTSKVNAVLNKVKALLRKRHTRFDESNAGFSKSKATFDEDDPVLREISTGQPLRRLAAAAPEEAAVANSVPSQCGTGCALRPTIDKAIADYSSNLAEAAREIAAAFTDARVQVYENKPRPVGVTVDYTINFLGFAGQRMILEWTLCEPTGRPLPKAWWRNVIVKQIVPSNESIKTSGNFWAPIPPKRGNYYFRLRVFDGSSEPTHKNSDPFH
jgi:hypothetical protein